MDDLDHNLLSAWQRVAQACRADPAEARRRWRRTRGWLLARVPRAWCLAVRASDTRIRPENFEYHTDDGAPFRQPHPIDLPGTTISRLCAPVRIPWPGVPLTEAARRLGRHPESLRHWLPVRPGRSRAQRAIQAPDRYRDIEDPRFALRVRYEMAQQHGHFGRDVPIVWSDRALDPGAVRGDPPHPVWGSLWQFLHRRIEENACHELQREPRWRPYRGEDRFRGWYWICPGRAGAVCGRRVHTLYYPLPVYTIPGFLGPEVFDVSEPPPPEVVSPEVAPPQVPAAIADGPAPPLRLTGQWSPGAGALPAARRFACDRCWNLRQLWLNDAKKWNEFVTYISAGLLYGREVERPAWVRYENKRPGKTESGRRKADDGRGRSNVEGQTSAGKRLAADG